MLNSFILFSLKHRLLVLTAAVSILIFGGYTLVSLPIDVFPDITKPTVTLLTEAHGMAPEEVEIQVTQALEMSLSGLPGLERMRSQSGIGLSIVYLEFGWGGDIYRHRQNVQERLELARARLPADIQPTLGPIGSLMGQIQQIALYSESAQLSPQEIRTLAEFTIRPQLLTISGISQVIAIGGELKQYQVLISPEKLSQYQIPLSEIEEKLQKINQNTTGGFLEKNGQEYLIRNIGALTGIEDIQKTFVGYHLGRPISVQDLAEVKIAARIKRGDGSYNGKPSVVLTIQKQPGADTVEITKNIDLLMSQLRKSLPADLIIKTDVFQQARFIEASIQGITRKLQYGSILVFIILILFLANVRMTVITLTAIPLSFLITALTFRFFDLTVNTMTLGGLAIAIGELVDDSIVDVENIFRRLRENALLPKPLSRLKVIYQASAEVRNSIVIATVIIGLVFLPLFTLDGLEGRLFAPLGFAYLISLFASLLVSLSVTPVLSYYFLDQRSEAHQDTKLVSWLKNIDLKILDWSLPRLKPLLIASGVLVVVSIIMVSFMGRDFLPKFNEGTALIALIAPPGVSLDESNKIGLNAEKIILSNSAIKSTSRRTGRAEQDEHAAGIHVSEIDVDFKEQNKDQQEVLAELRKQLKEAHPEVGINIGQPLSHLMDHMLTGVSAALVIKIFGPDLSVLKEKAIEAESLLKDIPGLADLRVEEQANVPQLKIFILKEEAARLGINQGDLSEALETSLYGKDLAQVYEDGQIYDLHLRFAQSSRATIEDIEKLLVKIAPNGEKILLSDVADIYESSGPNEVFRENGIRRIVISANAENRDIGSLAEEVQTKLTESLELPEGYRLTFSGQFESEQRASTRLLLFSSLALLAIVLVLYSQFKSYPIVLQILATLPLAFIGGVFALFFLDGTMTIASLIGFITLIGISSRNSIMMISHYLHLMKHEGETFTKAMIIRGSQERIVPVLMTASVAALALLPLVFAKNQPGSEVLYPVAVVIVGGLISSTLLDLILTPTLFYHFGQKSAEEYAQLTEEEEII